MKYTVLIARPEQPYDDYFMDHVEASTVREAQELAKRNAWEADNGPEDRPEDPDEAFDEIERYRIMIVIEGHHYDCSVP